MRISIPRWSRTVSRPRRLLSARLNNSNNKAVQKWSRETASVLEMVLRNQAPLPWAVLHKYAMMPPQLADIEPLLPMLEERALKEQKTVFDPSRSVDPSENVDPSKGVDSLGDFALKLGIVSQLSRPFLVAWINQLAEKDVYAALRIYKLAKSLPLAIGVHLYLQADQPIKAHEIANEIEIIVPKLRKQLIAGLINHKRLDLAQFWIDGWPAMQPTDVRWLHHLANQHYLANQTRTNPNNNNKIVGSDSEWALRLPKLPEKSMVPQPSRKIGPKLQHLVSLLNQILVAVPDLLAQAPVHCAWIESISSPSRESLETLAVVIAEHLTNYAYTPNWLPILRLVHTNCAVKILCNYPHLPAKAYAAVISRASCDNLDAVVGLMTPELFYSAECLHAVARINPRFFAEMTVPQSFLETKLRDHHLMALWQADPTMDWLFPLTLQSRSPRLLRKALLALVNQNERTKVKQLLTNYVVTQKLVLDPRILQLNRCAKLGAPKTHNWDAIECEQVVDRAMAQLFGSNHQQL